MERRGLGTKLRNGPGAPRQSWTGPIPVFDPSTLERIFELREAVWRNEPDLVDAHRLEASMLRDDHDAHGLHWIIKTEGSIVAAARICIHHDDRELPFQNGFHHLVADLPGPIGSLNRLVVHPSMRRQGLSRVLTDVRVEAARSRGARSIIVEAVPNRIRPLQDLGFVALGYSAGQPGSFLPGS